MSNIVRFAIVLALPKGQTAELEVPGFADSERVARHRAIMSACAAGWGDLDTVEVTSCRILDSSEWSD